MDVATNERAAMHAHLDEVYTMLPFTPAKGAGVWLEDAAGRRVLDLYGGHAVAALGYGHPRLSDTIARASRDLVFQTNALPLKIRDEAADALAEFAPPGVGRVFFVNSGAERTRTRCASRSESPAARRSSRSSRASMAAPRPPLP